MRGTHRRAAHRLGGGRRRGADCPHGFVQPLAVPHGFSGALLALQASGPLARRLAAVAVEGAVGLPATCCFEHAVRHTREFAVVGKPVLEAMGAKVAGVET